MHTLLVTSLLAWHAADELARKEDSENSSITEAKDQLSKALGGLLWLLGGELLVCLSCNIGLAGTKVHRFGLISCSLWDLQMNDGFHCDVRYTVCRVASVGW